MTSTSQPGGFAAYFAAQPTPSSAPLIHGLTSPPRTDSPSDSKPESSKGNVSESPATAAYGNATPVPTPPTHTPAEKKPLDISAYTKRAWRLVHDPELHPKGSAGRSKPKEIRQSGQGVAIPLDPAKSKVYGVSDPRKLELNYGANMSKGRKKYIPAFQKLQYQYDSNSMGPPPASQIVIWGFPPLVTAENIQTHFRTFGEIQELDFKVDSTSGASLGVCRIKYKVDKKDMMSGHISAKKAVQESVKVRLGGSFVHVEMDKDGLKTVRRVGEAIKKRHAVQAAQVAAREQVEKAAAAKDNPPPPPKPIPTGPAADRKSQTLLAPISHAPPPPSPTSVHPTSTDRLRANNDTQRAIDERTPLHESSRNRRTSPSPVRDRQKSISDSHRRGRSPDDRSRPRERSRSRERTRYRSQSRDRVRDRSDPRDRSRPRSRSRGRNEYRFRRRSPSRSSSRSSDRGRWRDDRRYSPPRRRSDSRGREARYRRRSPSSERSRDRDHSRERRRSLTPRKLRTLDDRPSSSAEKYPPPPSSIDEYRPAYSARFRPGIDDKSPPRDRKVRDVTPNSPIRGRHAPGSADRDEERGRTRKRSPVPRNSTPSSSRSPAGRRRRPASDSDSRSRSRSPTSRIPLLSSSISHKLGGRPYIFVSDRDLPVRSFSSRDLGLCFKKFHPSVYDDSHGFYIAFHNYQDARDCYAAHGDGKSFIDGYRLRMQLVDDKDTIRAMKSAASPTRRKPVPKKTVEEEAADIILAELKQVFMKDVRSRIVNPILFDLLDPSHYKDIQPKQDTPHKVETIKLLRPDPKIVITPTKTEKETPLLTKRAITNLLPRFRKKGVEMTKTEGRDRKLTKADVRPMHHQFNHYSDSEDDDELPQREATVASDDEDESSRPSRETTSLSTPEPSKAKGLVKPLVKVKDVASVKDEESEEELLKDMRDTKEELRVSVSKRKRIIDFTSSEDEEETSPSKKICVEPEVPEPMQMDSEVVVPQPSKAALLRQAKAKAAALRRQKKAQAQVKEVADSITIERAPVKETEQVQKPASKPKIAEVDLSEIDGEDELLLDLDGIQALVRDKEDYRFLLEAVADIGSERIHDIWTWAWKQKKLKALNLDGVIGPVKKLEPPLYSRINATGSARTEGYIKIPETEKSLYLPQRNKAIIPIGSEAARKTSRMNRVNNRRLAADMEVQKKTLATESDILRFNQLKARKKQLKFARSPIHDWGLFAMEDIEAHEMVIEYVGEIIRFQVAELREKQYERVGIGSSYLFRVDDENIIDATKTGNIARFINHCCSPNCSAKIIQVQGEKKIVIYADRFIAAGEEITYDYKFPREDVKIPCFCGSAHCKGTLN